MPIDYSKWDKIELSDDLDIEVHPNVDKKSFIKWKQRDIHEKRQQRNVEIKSILLQLTMYAKLNERVDWLLAHVPPEALLDGAKTMAAVNGHFDAKERFDYEKLKLGSTRKGLQDITFGADELDTPPYNEMIEDLFSQIKEDHPDAASDAARLVGYLTEHRAKIDDLLLKQAVKLDDLLYQKSLLISSDDYHTGFDRSFLNADKEDVQEPVQSQVESQPVQSQPVKPQPSSASAVSPASVSPASVSPASAVSPASSDTSATESSPKHDDYDDLHCLPQTIEFSKIPHTDLHKSAEFIIKHHYICTEHQKDSLIMTAFDLQLDNNSKGARQVIYQSLLLQYISQLAGKNASRDQTIRATKLFFSKLSDTSSPAYQAFNQDVENTAAHIKNRCKIIQEEHLQEGEEEALIQLKALDESTTLEVNPPAEGTPEYDIFMQKLSPEMRKAIDSGLLDEVNKIFATMKVEEAEAVLEVFNECNVIGISGVLENEEEFEKLKDQYEDHRVESEPEEQKFNTVDEVD